MRTLVVIGGGAAGIFCAVNAARLAPDLKVIVLEKSSRLLSKVRVSGGGRCNVTHACSTISELVKAYPRGGPFLKKAFSYFFVTDTINWFESRGVKLKTEEDGRMFPVTDSSETIIDAMIADLNRYHVEVRMQSDVRALRHSENTFTIELADKRSLQADYVCVATGGFPKLSMFDWLQQTGHSVAGPVPSLFTFNLPAHPLKDLMGVSVPNGFVKILGTTLKENGPVLITHWGLSGPAVLRLSAWGARLLQEKEYQFKALLNWVHPVSEPGVREAVLHYRAAHPAKLVMSNPLFSLPARLWSAVSALSGVKEQTRWADLPSAVQNSLIRNLSQQECVVSGKTTFKDEFVTCGGIVLGEVDPATMQSRLVPKLYFAGEILDVDGITGGYNFQHAWTSGYLVAASISSHK